MELSNEHPPFRKNLMKKTRNLLVKGTNAHMVICEVLRLAYDLIHEMEDKELKNKLTIRLTEAMVMAKKMSDRLHFYRNKYPQEPTGNRGKKFQYIHGTKRRIRVRMQRRAFS